MEDKKTRWERSRRTHFDDIVATYQIIRPEYPYELFADIFDYTKANTNKKALEIGAGTGKATTPFFNQGYDVTAVEIGENMAESLMKRFKGNDHFRVVIDSFEDALLNEDCYDLIYAASAFHWVDAEIGCPKAFRLLKVSGTFALFRYNAVPAVDEEIYEEIQAVYEEHYYSYYKSSERPAKKTHDQFKEPAEIFRSFRFNDLNDYDFKDISMKLYDATRTFSADEYMLMLDTFSDNRALPEKNRTALFSGIKDVILKHGGYHKVDYVFQLYMGKK